MGVGANRNRRPLLLNTFSFFFSSDRPPISRSPLECSAPHVIRLFARFLLVQGFLPYAQASAARLHRNCRFFAPDERTALESAPYRHAARELWMPFASVLTGFAARDVLAGRTPVYFTLIAIFRDKASRWPLLAVGILASIWMELDMLVFQMMGQADLAQWKITAEGVDVESIAAHFPAGAFLTAFALYLPLLLMTLFAPLLIVQNRQSVIKSLFLFVFRHAAFARAVFGLARLRSGTRLRYFSDDRIHFHCGGRPHVLHLYGADPHCPHFGRLPSWHLGDVPRHLRLKPAGR